MVENRDLSAECNIFFKGENTDSDVVDISKIRFLNESEHLERVTYASYPRSGNTFIRNNLEQISGIYTGGNMSNQFELDIALKDKGFKGEYVRDDRVWIVYTHYPVVSEYPFTATRLVVGVRYPFDVFDSFFNLSMTNSHCKTITDDEYMKY
jgi:hypothetical protein